MRIPRSLEARDRVVVLAKRESRNNTLIVISAIVITIFAILLITYLLTLRFRRHKVSPQKQKNQTAKLPSLFSKWRRRDRRGEYSTSLQANSSNELNRRESGGEQMSGADPERQSTTGVDRNTSVRSVMTLPAYSPAARENERILGREGERAGIDTVVEYPEDANEEETRREEEMESLYQIRLARRQEAREREERRQQRREARARGDNAALTDIRRRAEAAADENLSQILIAEHQSRNRERRVSSVAYGDLGVARHDGTRLRANSTESDNRPLLDSAASISGNSQRSRALSNNTLHSHYRGPSASSVLSVSTRASDDFEFPESTERSRSRSNDDDFEVVSLSHPRSRSASRVATPQPSPNTNTTTVVPSEDAPAYEYPPDYESPIRTRAPQLPTLERLPSIHVTTEPTPVDGRPRSDRSPR
ncbi:hypothetical protein CC78DRAFT_611153 [Lojkania enalia]|uniref:Uncharacterized protein n=1 Tax=Lojkania enalia TaxID=147567 RepID=A0A9P4NDA5_9PLEO|nr:hypothetical protein CC78DRAFT_611153 [Didymosphaeria enalia]